MSLTNVISRIQRHFTRSAFSKKMRRAHFEFGDRWTSKFLLKREFVVALTLQEFIHVYNLCVLVIIPLQLHLLSLVILRSPPPSNVKWLPSGLWCSKESQSDILSVSKTFVSFGFEALIWSVVEFKAMATSYFHVSFIILVFTFPRESKSTLFITNSTVHPCAPFQKTEACQYVN